MFDVLYSARLFLCFLSFCSSFRSNRTGQESHDLPEKMNAKERIKQGTVCFFCGPEVFFYMPCFFFTCALGPGPRAHGPSWSLMPAAHRGFVLSFVFLRTHILLFCFLIHCFFFLSHSLFFLLSRSWFFVNFSVVWAF